MPHFQGMIVDHFNAADSGGIPRHPVSGAHNVRQEAFGFG